MVRPLYAILGALIILVGWLGLVALRSRGEAAAMAMSLADSAARAALPGCAARGYLLAADLERQRLLASDVARDSAAGQALVRRIIAARMAAARVLLEAGYVEAAEAIALQGAQADFDDVQARALLLEVRLRGGRPEAARRELMRQLVKREDPGLLCLLGNSFLRSGHAAEAEACLQRALKLQPHHVRSLLALAALERAQGHTRDATALREQAGQAAVTADERAAVADAEAPASGDVAAAAARMGEWGAERWPSLAVVCVYLLFLASPAVFGPLWRRLRY